jgi:hypothetical protein
MDWKDITKMIADLAPTLGVAIGSVIPGGALIGGAAGKALQAIFGTSEPDKLATILATDPEAAAKLRQAEIQFQLEEMKAYLADVQDARKRQIEHEQATGKSDTHLYVLAWILVGGFFSLLGCLLFVPIPNDQSGVVAMLFGALSAGFGSVVGFFFGSSRGSQDKSATILNLSGKK